jgi:hypothetical protein
MGGNSSHMGRCSGHWSKVSANTSEKSFQTTPAPCALDCKPCMKNVCLATPMVVHSCNSSYLGGRSRRIESSRPVQAELARPYLRNKIKTKWLSMWLKWYSICIACVRFLIPPQNCLPQSPPTPGTMRDDKQWNDDCGFKLQSFRVMCCAARGN